MFGKEDINMRENELAEFLEPTDRVGKRVATGITIMLGAVVFFFVTSFFPFGILWLILSIIAFVRGFILIFDWEAEAREVSDHLGELTKKGQLTTVLEEINNGHWVIPGVLCLGETYIFGKEAGRCIKYSDLRTVWEHVHRRGGSINRHELKCTRLLDGECLLCKLPNQDVAEEIQQALDMILSKNPSVQIKKS